MRLIKTLESGSNAAKIYKLDGEYIVKFYKSGVYQVDADYFTDDKTDAVGTASVAVTAA